MHIRAPNIVAKGMIMSNLVQKKYKNMEYIGVPSPETKEITVNNHCMHYTDVGCNDLRISPNGSQIITANRLNPGILWLLKCFSRSLGTKNLCFFNHSGKPE